MDRYTVTGNIGQAAKVQEVNGNRSINFSIAINRKYADKDGVVIEKTKWINCTYWRRKDSSIEVAKYLTAGTKVLVEGELDVHTYEDKDRKTQASIDLNVQYLELLGSKPKEATEPAAADSQPAKPIL
jgi:single-strand DNA-binding protein